MQGEGGGLMAAMFRVKARYVNMPNYPIEVRAGIGAFLSQAGEYLAMKMRAKFGTYQPGWPLLSPTTIALKSGRKKGRKQRHYLKSAGQFMGPMANIGGRANDMPLIDTGKMLRSVRHIEQGYTTIVGIDWPMVQHEQDPEIGAFNPRGNLPARPLMWPTWMEEEPNIVNMLEMHVAGRL